MESQDHEEETEGTCEEQTAYGAHQEYGPDGNYDGSHYAMSASSQYDQQADYLYEEEDEETYAS
jgi:hypothetical protein